MNKAVGKRILAAVLCVCMLAGLGHVSSLKVKAANLTGGSITLRTNISSYNGNAVSTADIITEVKDGNNAVVAAGSYTLEILKNGSQVNEIKDAGTYSISAVGDAESKTAPVSYTVTTWNLLNAIGNGVTLDLIPIERGTTINGIDDIFGLYLGDKTTGTKLKGVKEEDYTAVDLTVEFTYKINNDRNGVPESVTFRGRNNYESNERTERIAWVSKKIMISYPAIEEIDYANLGTTDILQGITVTDKNSTPLDSTDYTVSFYREGGSSVNVANINQAGKYYFVVSGTPNSNYRDFVSEQQPFTVTKSLAHGDIRIVNPPTEVTYNGQKHEPKLEIWDGNYQLIEGTDYTLTYGNNTNTTDRGLINILAGSRGVYNLPVGSSKYVEFTIRKLNLSSVSIVQDPTESLVYDGTEKTPTVIVSYNGTTFDNITWIVTPVGDNPDITSARNNVRYIVTTDDTNFEGQKEVTCNILPKPFGDDIIITYNGTTNTDYTGSKWRPEIEKVYDNTLKKDLVEGANGDYVITTDGNSDAGENYKLTISGQNNYSGTRTELYTINPIDISGNNSPVTIEFKDTDLVYTGKAQQPRIIVKYGERTLTEGADYDIVGYEDNINAGTGKVVIRGKKNYIGEANNTFEIKRKNIEDEAAVKITPEYSELEFVAFDVNLKPDVKITYNGMELESTDFTTDTPSGSETDRVTGNDITLTIKGIGTNYEGTRTVKYKIIPRKLTESNLKIYSDVGCQNEAAGEILNYKGNGIEVKFPNLWLKCDAAGDDNWRLLNGDSDYEIIYNGDNKDLGPATVTLKGKGNFGSEVTIPFYIKGDISSTNGNERLQVEINEMPFTGAPITLAEKDVTLTYIHGDEEHELEWGKDFEILPIEGQDYTNVGSPQIKIVSKGDKYQGELIITFDIVKRNLQDAFDAGQLDITIASIVYTGREMDINAVKNGAAIQYNKLVDLNKDGAQDYDIEFVEGEDITNAGEVKVLIKALDASRNFTGEVEVADKFVIEQRELKQTDVGDGTTGIITFVVNGGEKLVLVEQDAIRLYEQDLNLTYKNDAENLHFVDAKNKEDEKPKFTYEVVDTGYKDFKAIGADTIRIVGTENFKGEVDIPVQIWGDFAAAEGKEYKDETGKKVPVLDVTYEELQNFAEGEINPEVVVTYRGVELVQTADEVKDFGVVYEGDLENVTPADVAEENQPRFTVTGASYYMNSVNRNFTIQKCDLATAYQEDEEGNPIGSITVTGYNGTPGLEHEDVIYNKKEWRPLSGIFNHTKRVGETWADRPQDAWENPDYFNIEYKNNIQGGAKDKVGGPTVTITATEGNPNYKGSVTIHFTIHGRNLESEFNKEIDPIENLVFDGEGQMPIPVIRVEARRPIDEEDRETVTLVYGEDFLLEYENNVNAGVNTAIAKIMGINNYSGMVTTNFTINPKVIDSTAVAVKGYTLTIEESKYTGSQITPKVTIIDNNRVVLEELSAPGLLAMLGAKAMGVELVEGIDFTVTPANTNINVGEAAVTITGIGNYTGTLENEPFEIIPLPWDDESITVAEIAPQTYTGTPIKPAVTVTMNNIPLTEGVDFEVSVASGFDNVNVPSGKLTITSTADNYNLTGFRDVEFNIVPKDLGDRDIVIEDIENQALVGGKAEPRLVVQYMKDGEEAPITLVEGTDYTVSYDGNTETGTRATATITGIEGGNYTGTQTVLFTIAANIDEAELKEAIPDQEYTGSPIEPKFQLVLNNRTLREGADYSVKYLNNTEAGEATIIVQGAMAFGGTKEIHFNIVRSIKDLIGVSGLAENYIYTGHPVEPSLGKVALNLGEANEIILEKDKDYTLSFENNTAVGEATMTVNGAGVYSGSQSFTFNITHKSVAQCTVNGVRPMTYDGNPQKPTISVLDAGNGVQLQAGTDYNVVYLNSNRPGEARVIVSGKGNYTGNQVLTYKINLPNVSGVGAVANSSKKATLTWTAGSNETTYEIYDSDNVLVSRNKKTSYVVYGLKPETEYSYKIRSYVIIGGQIFYSGFTNVSVRTN